METGITIDEYLDNEDNDLLSIIASQVNVIYYLNEIELANLYDAFNEDKIKCFTNAFKTIDLAQKALQKKIRESNK